MDRTFVALSAGALIVAAGVELACTNTSDVSATFTVSGTASGLAGAGLVLRDNGTDDLQVSANGQFTFATALASGASFHVTVLAQPSNPVQQCAVINGNGTVVGANVTTVAISCTAGAAQGLVFATVSAGGFHSCGLTIDGAAYCWGDNWMGGLGDGTTNRSATPVEVLGGLTFRSLSAAETFTCGVTLSGAAYCWGSNYFGQLGNGTQEPSTTPAAVTGGLTFAALSVGPWHACGVTTGGKAYCWGYDYSGELGVDSTTFARNCPLTQLPYNYCLVPVPVAGGLTFATVAAGSLNSCGLQPAGAVYCWGDNHRGALGNGRTVNSRTPIRGAGLHTFQQAAVEGYSACAITAGGAAWCWGDNTQSQLGTGTATGPETCPPGTDPCSTHAVPVAGGLLFSSLSAGYFHACAVTRAGAAYCWGGNRTGVLGNGTLDSSATPVAVSGGLTFATLGIGGNDNDEVATTCGVTTGGTAYCWGDNKYGQLGDGSTTASSVPVKVAGQP